MGISSKGSITVLLSGTAVRLKREQYPVAMRPGVTPVPIPNTTVKTGTAEGTMLETAWESRWLPDLFFN